MWHVGGRGRGRDRNRGVATACGNYKPSVRVGVCVDRGEGTAKRRGSGRLDGNTNLQNIDKRLVVVAGA